MHNTGRFLRRGLLAFAAVAAALAVAFSLACLPAGELLLAGAAFLQNPAAAVYALRNRGSTQSTNADWPAASPIPASTPAPAGMSASTPESAAPTATPDPTPTPTATPGPDASPPPGAGLVEAERFPQGSGDGYIPLEAGSIKNSTDHDDEVLADTAAGGLLFTVELNSGEPQVLLLHTHATETYQPWDALYYDPAFTARTQDTDRNMCAVGDRMAELLNEAGVNTLHDTTLHDTPSYTESYHRSAETVNSYLEQYPSIKVVLDVHRDAIERDGTRIKPLTNIDGQDTAQVMIICGCDNGGTVQIPNWKKNLRFAAAWESEMESLYPGLTRPVLCGYRFYNQDLSTGSLLIEIGGHANTLDEALRGGEYAAKALAALFGAG